MRKLQKELAEIFSKALKGENISKDEESKHRTYTIQFLGKLY